MRSAAKRDLLRRLMVLERASQAAPGFPPIDWSVFSNAELGELEALVRRQEEGPPLAADDLDRLTQLGAKVSFIPAGPAIF